MFNPVHGYKKLDYDGSGYINPQDFVNYLAKYDKDVTIEEAEAVLAWWDLNNDNKVCLEDFRESIV
jgi:Ca2+-binding EF-hand superfamily protein